MPKHRTSGHPVFTSPPYRAKFQNCVWDIVARIPFGRVTTYGKIASMIPRPQSVGAKYYNAAKARWVGSAMASCPDGLPWHRVVNSQGRISERSKNDHHLKQREMLESESVIFDERGKIELEEFLWVRLPGKPGKRH